MPSHFHELGRLQVVTLASEDLALDTGPARCDPSAERSSLDSFNYIVLESEDDEDVNALRHVDHVKGVPDRFIDIIDQSPNDLENQKNSHSQNEFQVAQKLFHSVGLLFQTHLLSLLFERTEIVHNHYQQQAVDGNNKENWNEPPKYQGFPFSRIGWGEKASVFAELWPERGTGVRCDVHDVQYDCDGERNQVSGGQLDLVPLCFALDDLSLDPIPCLATHDRHQGVRRQQKEVNEVTERLAKSLSVVPEEDELVQAKDVERNGSVESKVSDQSCVVVQELRVDRVQYYREIQQTR